MFKVLYFMASDNSGTHELYKKNNLYDWMIPSINQCDKTNNDCEIHIITDINDLKEKFTSEKIYIHNFVDYYSEDIDWFNNNYIHLSTNQHHFEKMAIVRLFYLRNFCIKNNINEFLHLESDVLVYSNIIDDYKYYKDKNINMTLFHGLGAGVCFINGGIEMLNKITECIINSYSVPQKYPRAFDLTYEQENYKKNTKLNNHAGGVSDMTFWGWYKDNYGNTLVDMDENIDGVFYQTCLYTYFDHPKYDMNMWKFINDSDIGVVKDLKIENDNCYGYYLGERVRIKYLHCHGHTKKIIPKYLI